MAFIAFSEFFFWGIGGYDLNQITTMDNWIQQLDGVAKDNNVRTAVGPPYLTPCFAYLSFQNLNRQCETPS